MIRVKLEAERVRETPRAYRRRTGASYQPPDWLTAEARPLAPAESCPTLFRYPGPFGLAEFLAGALRQLAPEAVRSVWLSATRTRRDVAGIRHFGALAVLQPLRLDPCRGRGRGAYVGVNRRVPSDAVVWVPPAALRARLPWDRLQDRSSAEPLLARFEGARVREELARYVEELRALERAGARPRSDPWHAVPLASRRRVLARHGLRPSWSRTAGR